MIQMWHGGRKWDSVPEILASRKGRAEWGPGIYMTNFFDTARRYAKGGGVVRKLVLTPKNILEQSALSLTETCDFVTSVLTRSKQKATIDQLIDCANRNILDNKTLLGYDDRYIHAEVIVNLCVNGGLAAGAKGQALAEFLVSQGVDAAFSCRYGREFWGTVYNTACIEQYEVIPASKVPLALFELPDPFTQISDPNAVARLLQDYQENTAMP